MGVLAPIQAGLTLIVFHYVITLFLFREYESSNVQRMMKKPAILFLRWFILLFFTIFVVYGLCFFVQRAWYAGS